MTDSRAHGARPTEPGGQRVGETPEPTRPSKAVIVDLNTIDVQEMGGGLSVTFPFSSADGMTATATVLQRSGLRD